MGSQMIFPGSVFFAVSKITLLQTEINVSILHSVYLSIIIVYKQIIGQ